MAVSNRNRKALDKVLAFGSPRRRYPPKTESLRYMPEKGLTAGDCEGYDKGILPFSLCCIIWPIRLNGWEYALQTEGRFFVAKGGNHGSV